MAHACPYCHVAAPDAAPLCPQCGAPQPVQASSPEQPGSGWGRWIDPMEGAFAVMLPQGWAAQGGTFLFWDSLDPETPAAQLELQFHFGLHRVGGVMAAHLPRLAFAA